MSEPSEPTAEKALPDGPETTEENILPGDSRAVEKELSGNPRSLIIAGLVVIILFFGGLVTWSALLPFSGAVIAPGTVKISQERQTVQHLEGGIVENILVREGDTVESGDILVQLVRPEIDAQVSVLRSRLRARTAAAARLRAESLMAGTIIWPPSLADNRDQPEVAEVMELENEIFMSRKRTMEGQISLHRSQIVQLKEQIEGMKEELTAQEDIIATLDEEIEAKQALFEAEHIDKTEILELKRRLAERKGRSGRLRQNIAETRQKKEEIRLRIVNLREKYTEEAFAQLSQVQDDIFELNDQLLPKIDAQRRMTIRAPVSGEVINMRVHSQTTGVIHPGQEILDIVPRGAELLVEGRINPDDITSVMKGQKVRVQLTPFNRRTTPPVTGWVEHVSGDHISRDTALGEETFYLVHIRIEKEELENSGVYLSPGMPAVSYIETEQRTILGYLVEPILDMMDRSLREP